MPLPVRLTCGEAVAAALAVLGNDHPPISAVGFHYGNCPPYARCLMLPNLDQGFVVFRFGRSGTVDLHVTVRVDNAGTVVADSPQPVPAYRSLSVLTQPGHQQ